ncbi:MAG: hypothetical protein R3F53_18200 [Gammaproteobacteria bacterium]
MMLIRQIQKLECHVRQVYRPQLIILPADAEEAMATRLLTDVSQAHGNLSAEPGLSPVVII